MKKILFLCILFASCGPSFEHLKPPIILVAKTSNGGVILSDGRNTVIMSSDYVAARSIADSYEPGDTLYFIKQTR